MKKPLTVALIIMAALVTTIAVGAVMMTACSQSQETAKKKPEPEPISNLLTGYTAEDGFDESARDRRVVAFVVENAPEARPQWGMDDPEYSPDIILEAEVEGGITRTLWLYQDYKKLPEVIGPMRSARPPFIRFSEFWNSVFIHWGASHSAGGYTGANEVFTSDGVEHIDQMSFTNECGLYDRDHSRGVSAEHTGIVYGEKVEAALKEEQIKEKRKAPPSELKFNKTAKPMSDTRADEVSVDYSSRTDWETTKWTYSEEDKQYHTENFENDLKRDNLLILYAETEYITKDNYQGPGGASSVTYCDYSMEGGKGKLISMGTVKDIQWEKKDGQLVLIDVEATKAAQAKAAEENADKAEDETEPAEPIVVEAKLNKGKTWIGWISNNNGGKVEITANPESTDGESGEGEGSSDSTEDGSEPAPTEVDGDAE